MKSKPSIKLIIVSANQICLEFSNYQYIECIVGDNMNSDDDDEYYEDDSDNEDFEDQDLFDQNDADLDEGYLGNSRTDRLDSARNSQLEDENFNYKCFTTDEVVSLMKESISEVNEILNVSISPFSSLPQRFHYRFILLSKRLVKCFNFL